MSSGSVTHMNSRRGDVTQQAPPSRKDSEASVLGTCLHEGGAAFRVRVLELDESVFYVDVHRSVFRAMKAVAARGEVATARAVKDELIRTGSVGLVQTLGGLLEEAGSTLDAASDLKIIERVHRARLAQAAAAEFLRGVNQGMDPGELQTQIDNLAALVQRPAATTDEEEADIFDLLAEAEPEFEWLIPDLVERGERLILTGREGIGKSLLLGQLAVRLASGLHPVEDIEIEPARVLLVDCENSRREMKRRLRPLVIQAAERLESKMVFVQSRPEGLSLDEVSEDRTWLEQRLRATRADLLIMGPLYKMASGDPNDERDMGMLRSYLDHLRVRFGVTLILEAHMTHDDKSGRPFGWSGWRRWAEVGLQVTEQGLREWRPSRHPIKLPRALTRGGQWHFTASSRAADETWARIVEHVNSLPPGSKPPSIRRLEEVLDVPKTTVDRVIKEHQKEWMELWR